MKKIMPMIAAAMLVAAVAWAGEAPRTVVPGETKEHAVNVELSLVAQFPTLPDAPRFTAKGAGALAYRITGQQAIIEADSIPQMTFESEGPIGDLEKLTVVTSSIPGTAPVIDWSQFPRIVLKSVDLRVRAYEGPAGTSSKPLLDIVFEDLSLATDEITVEGIEAQGYVDAERAEAQIVVQALLPDDPFPVYAEWLAGEPVILEMRVAIINPYKK